MTLNQIIGYRSIIVSNGTFGSGSMEDIDFALFDDWLTSSHCNGNANRQVFMMDGDQTASLLNNWPLGTTFMTNVLGASLLCDAFNGDSNDPACAPPEEASCVRYLAAPGGAFGAPADVDAYGNWCPQRYGYNVLNAIGTGIGNRYFRADGGGEKEASYAEVVNEDLSAGANYRTIMTSAALSHLTLRDLNGPDRCPTDAPSIFGAIASELGAALRWGFGVADNASIPKLVDAKQLSTCEGTWSLPTDVDAAESAPLVNRLYANAPNPFNPRTTIKYSLASSAPVRIDIYDVDGRHVRTLVDSPRAAAGRYEAVWDGTNDRGRVAASGIYWARMKAGSFTSNRKMLLLE
jgi:hypothetical protein